MSFPNATRLTAGTMSWASVNGIFTTYRSFLNDIPAADVTAGAVQGEHLVRPLVTGFPSPGIRANRQIVLGCQYGMNANTARTPEEWASRPERLSIRPYLLRGGETWLTPLGFRLHLPEAATVTFDAAFEFFVRTTFEAAAGPTYPQSTNGTPTSDAGAFYLFTQRRFTADGDIVSGRFTSQAETKVPVYPLYGDAMDYGDASLHRYHDAGQMLWTADLVAGTWDFWLGFQGRSTRVTSFNQLDVSAFSATLEALM